MWLGEAIEVSTGASEAQRQDDCWLGRERGTRAEVSLIITLCGCGGVGPLPEVKCRGAGWYDVCGITCRFVYGDFQV